VRFVGRPILLEIEQEVRPVSWKAVLVEVFDGERETVVDTNYGRDVRREFLAEPLGGVNSEPLATGIRRLRAGVVDADVAFEMGTLRILLLLAFVIDKVSSVIFRCSTPIHIL
jgi:hypothetical protein